MALDRTKWLVNLNLEGTCSISSLFESEIMLWTQRQIVTRSPFNGKMAQITRVKEIPTPASKLKTVVGRRETRLTNPNDERKWKTCFFSLHTSTYKLV